jgi:serine/threonine protein kinase
MSASSRQERSASVQSESVDTRASEDALSGFAPTYRPPVAKSGVSLGAEIVAALQIGQRLGDFDLVAVLGSGAFARVFLARQVSLDREVALKISANRGMEARTLASLEHEYIVQVFSEEIDRERDLRWMCMQYVPGTTLDRIIRALSDRQSWTWTGSDFLATIDALSTRSATFDPSALRDRELLATCDQEEAVCWIGARLAEALAYAHSRGVLHRDIKPANILVNPYGRPFLADFNIALDPGHQHGSAGAMFGGTLAYMAPEHLDAFNPDTDTSPEAVDERSDVFSLGVVLTELYTGRSPFGRQSSEDLGAVAMERRCPPPTLGPDSRVPAVLRRILLRCLAGEPAERYGRAIELADALDGARSLSTVTKELNTIVRMVPLLEKHPFLAMLLLAVVPHMLGSIVNISYNAIRIVGQLDLYQQAEFARIVVGYNAVLYPLCVWLVYRATAQPFWVWRQLRQGRTIAAESVDAARLRLLKLPGYTCILAIIGWGPGAILFPWLLDLLAGPVGWPIYGHFVISFAISGLIALTYSYFAVNFMVLRGLYPRLWSDAHDFTQKARLELRGRKKVLKYFQWLAGAIPCAGAMLALGVQSDISHYQTFRVLVICLIALGLLGFSIANMAHDCLSRILSVFAGVKGNRT